MSKKQLLWVYCVLLGSIIHSLRDLLQFLGVKTLLSTVFVKTPYMTSRSWIWSPWNTVIIESVLILLCLYLLYKKKFGAEGKLTIGIVMITGISFLYYWFYL